MTNKGPTAKVRRHRLYYPLLILWTAAGIVIPYALVSNCSGYDGVTLAATTCDFDHPVLRGLADKIYGIVMLSSYMMGIPLILYLFAVIGLGRRVLSYVLPVRIGQGGGSTG